MDTFDRLHNFQFVLFFEGPPREAAPETLGELVSQLEAGKQRLGLKFAGPGQQETQLTQNGVTQTVTWAAGGGIWRLTCSHQRLDLFFDAKGYSDVAEGIVNVSVPAVCDRVAANLSLVPSLLSRRVTRAALILTTQANDGGPCAPLIVQAARSALNQQLSSETTDAGDIAVRVNRMTAWTLGGSQWTVNRIEAASIDIMFKQGGGVERLLTWQVDANTSPGNDPSQDLDQAAIIEFFTMARDWLQSRYTQLVTPNADR